MKGSEACFWMRHSPARVTRRKEILARRTSSRSCCLRDRSASFLSARTCRRRWRCPFEERVQTQPFHSYRIHHPGTRHPPRLCHTYVSPLPPAVPSPFLPLSLPTCRRRRAFKRASRPSQVAMCWWRTTETRLSASSVRWEGGGGENIQPSNGRHTATGLGKRTSALYLYFLLSLLPSFLPFPPSLPA